MFPQFDLFRVNEEDVPLWCSSADTFEEAEVKARTLAQASKRDYIIFNQETGNRVTIKPSD